MTLAFVYDPAVLPDPMPTVNAINAGLPVAEFVIDGSTMTNDARFTGTQAYGIFLGTSTDDYVITSNNYRGNVNAGVGGTTGSSATKVIANNIG